MKKVKLSLTGSDPMLVKQALNNLSGVVAVDVHGGQAIAHCGDRLDSAVLVQKIEETGGRTRVISEQMEF